MTCSVSSSFTGGVVEILTLTSSSKTVMIGSSVAPLGDAAGVVVVVSRSAATEGALTTGQVDN